MSATADLTAELRAEVKHLEDDLRGRLAQQPAVNAKWRAEHNEALSLGRTAASWQEWSEDRITLAAVAWVLVTVFIRFVEDNHRVRPVWISGPRERRAEALDAQAAFLREAAATNPDVTDREWLEQAISYLAGLPSTHALVDETSALWLVTPSGDAATRLLNFWRERNEAGGLVRDLQDDTLDTRFLGDLYQDLSEEARSRYALLQTPVFVEEFILDRTLEPALRERSLEGFRMIDPTCGSGHFLLGAFDRLLERWNREAPGLDSRARVQEALDAIHGVDLNPYAIAVTRFRLTIAALQASGDHWLEDAPDFAYHLAVGDSLLHGLDQGELDLGAEFSADRTAAGFVYPTENLAALRAILENGRYDVVVGNPPYITVKDSALNALYRRRYHYLKGTYALTVPFMERFFDLAKNGERAGWVGQITSNSFMKREFGAPLIEKFFPTKDLRFLADTSGAYIPGHGTPTVILVGRNSSAVSATVRAVLGVRGEPSRPEDPAKGLVWTTLADHVDEAGYSDQWITVVDLDRAILAAHPWSLSGGGAIELKRSLDDNSVGTLRSRGIRVGGLVTTGEDSAFEIGDQLAAPRVGLRDARRLVAGEQVKDYVQLGSTWVVFPYSEEYELTRPLGLPECRVLWPSKTVLQSRRRFGTPMRDLPEVSWYQYRELYVDRLRSPAVAVFVKIATHNHAIRSESGTLFREACHGLVASDADLMNQILAVLNSSTACFWLKENSHDKGSQSGTGGFMHDEWERFFEFTGTTLQEFPLPSSLPVQRALSMDLLARRLAERMPSSVMQGRVPSLMALKEARSEYGATRTQMIAQQEELDWEVYRLFGLIENDLTYQDDLPVVTLGERAFEIVLAASGEKTVWFDRHGSVPTTHIPTHWPAAYRELVERRIALIESHPFIRLLERPEHKRRWATESWEKLEERALRRWLLDRLENERFWFDRAGRPTPRSVAQLADDVARDADLLSVLALWEGRPDVAPVASLQRLLAEEAVPYLAAYRYKGTGLLKHEAWEHTWDLQRREDAGERVGAIPIPPKYTSADFVRKEYWAHRGKLDVPKERFILYPDAGRDTDPTAVLGWAGWDHAQQALAIDQLIQQREAEGWDDERLIPFVAGWAELLPWVQQWHANPDPFYGGTSAAAFFADQLDDRARQVERTVDQLRAWRPTARRGRARKAATT